MLSMWLLLTTAGALCQMRSGSSMGGPPQGGMNQPGMRPNDMQPNGSMAMQNNPETQFVATMRRNSKAESDLSKLALKNSTNENVKKLAQQVISENRRDEMALNNATSRANSSGMPIELPVPDQTRQAEKKMKKLTGTPFDAMYLSEMDGYVRDDQKVLGEASSMPNSADLGSVAMQLRNTTDARSQQITQVAQSENIKFK